MIAAALIVVGKAILVGADRGVVGGIAEGAFVAGLIFVAVTLGHREGSRRADGQGSHDLEPPTRTAP